MRSVFAILLLVAVGGAARQRPASPAAPFLWHDPGNVSALDLSDAGAGVPAPQPPFTFVREDLSGTNPKVFVRDARGTLWNVKFGYEVHNDVFCWRIVRACGYFSEPSFFVAAGRIEQYRPIRRANRWLQSDGRFTEARFQYRDPQLHFLARRSWRWDRSPFSGTAQMDGLKLLLMLFSNWDNKDARVGAGGSNTAIFERRGRPVYAFVDWGSGMGSWGSVPGRETDWNCRDYAAQTPSFVAGVKNGSVVFGWDGAIPQGFRTGIPVEHVRWLMKYLGRISDAQLAAALEASGASPSERACFLKAMRDRIEQLRRQ